MQAEQPFWNCVNDVAELFVCTSANETFDHMWTRQWRKFEQKSRDVVMNRYIMQRAVHYYNDNRLEDNAKNLTNLRLHIGSTCKELGVDHEEWLHGGWDHVMRKIQHEK
jgi:hypothetical protein